MLNTPISRQSVRSARALPISSTLHNGRHIIEEQLGAGGFGITYRAMDRQLRRAVAIKELFPPGCARQGAAVIVCDDYSQERWSQAIQIFLREAQLLAALEHPGVIPVYDYFDENNSAYIVMKLVDGVSLAEIGAHRGRLDEKLVLRYLLQIGEALSFAHSQGVLHCDIKPSNIMITKQDQPILIDFGSALELVSNSAGAAEALVTHGFSPPELFVPTEPKGAYTDVYGLAATCFTLLTGKFLDTAEPDYELLPNEAVRRVLKRGLAIEPADRPQTVAAFVDELRSATNVATAQEVHSVSDSMDETTTFVGPTVRVGDAHQRPTGISGDASVSETSEAVWVRDLAARSAGDKVEISWTPAGWDETRIFRREDELPAWCVEGAWVRLVDLPPLGREVAVRQSGFAVDELPTSEGEVIYVPVTLTRKGGRIGRPAAFACLADVSDLVGHDRGNHVQLQWRWPGGVSVVQVAWSTLEPPTLRHNMRAERVSRGQYRDGYRIPDYDGGPLHIAVFAGIGKAGRYVWSVAGSPGSRTFLPGRSPVRLRYRLRFERGWRTRRLVLEIDKLKGEGGAPELVLVGRRGLTMPLKPRDGIEVVRVPAGSPFPFSAVVELQDFSLGEPVTFRLHMIDPTSSAAEIEHPSPDSLKLK